MTNGESHAEFELGADLGGYRRETLERWSRRPTTSQALALRARIVLTAALGKNNVVVAKELGITRGTVRKWRSRYLQLGPDGLLDEPRPGVPRTISDAQIEAVVTRTLETMPKGATHWSTRSMAEASGLSQSTISRIWRAFGLQPHRVESFKLSTDPLFVEKVRDIVGLYMNLRSTHSCSASMRRRKPKRSTVPNRSCRCALASRNGGHMTTSATAPPRSLPRSTWRRAKSLDSANGSIAQSNSARS